MIRLLLVFGWGLGVVDGLYDACSGVSSPPWLVAVAWGLPIGWAVAYKIRRMDPVGYNMPPLLCFLLTLAEDEGTLYGLGVGLIQLVGAVVVVLGAIVVNRLGYEFAWPYWLLTLGACMLAQYYDLHFQRVTTNTKSTDAGHSAGPDGTF